MEKIISAAVNSLADFLNLKKSAVGTAEGESIFSFVYPAAEVSGKANELIESQDPVFIIEKSEEEYKFTGCSKAAEVMENGNQRFFLIDKKMREYKHRFLNNWDDYPDLNIPLFVGAVEFPVDHSDNMWENFNDSLWIIPELILLEYKNNSYIIFNSLSAINGFKNLTVHYKKLLESILLRKSKPSMQSASSEGFVQKTEGNTPKEKKKWKNQVNGILEEIASESVQKVVLSRKIDLFFNAEINFTEVLKKLSDRFPGCTVFLYRNKDSVFFGASPERLLRFNNSSVEFDVMAGSAPRGRSPEEDAANEKELLTSKKNLSEHKIVLEFINNAIKPFAEEIFVQETGVKKYSNIQHLWTKVSAKSKTGSSVLQLTKAVYPSPSICGMPKETALSFIKKIEGHKRGLYSGIIGWMNFDAGEFIIAIRSALYRHRKLTVFAGCGIVDDSSADDEWKETELKLNPIQSLFSDENKS